MPHPEGAKEEMSGYRLGFASWQTKLWNTQFTYLLLEGSSRLKKCYFVSIMFMAETKV